MTKRKQRRSNGSVHLRLDVALGLMHIGGSMILTHTAAGRVHHVHPGDQDRLHRGGPVTGEVAAQIKAHESVVGCRDGLWPGLDQVWKMRTFVREAAE